MTEEWPSYFTGGREHIHALATLLMIAIMLSGMLAFHFLPVAALPEVD
jgi:hypothetical protein